MTRLRPALARATRPRTLLVVVLATVALLVLAVLLAPAPRSAALPSASAIAGRTAAADTASTADDTVTWGVRPGTSKAYGAGRPHFVYDRVAAGATIRDSLVVANHGDERLRLLVYAADGLTTASGQLDLLPRGERSVDLGTWVRPDRTRIEVEPGATVRVPFTVRVPANASPGDHTGGIVTSLVTPRSDGAITVDRRLGSRIHLTVDGALAPELAVERLRVGHHGTLNPAAAGSATVRFRVHNTGNVRMSGAAAVTLQGPFGLGRRQQRLAVPELLPGASLDLAAEVDGVWPLVRLSTEVALEPKAVGVDDAARRPMATGAGATTWAVPWSALTVILVGGLVAALLRRQARCRRTAQQQRVAEAVEAALREQVGHPR